MSATEYSCITVSYSDPRHMTSCHRWTPHDDARTVLPPRNDHDVVLFSSNSACSSHGPHTETDPRASDIPRPSLGVPSHPGGSGMSGLGRHRPPARTPPPSAQIFRCFPHWTTRRTQRISINVRVSVPYVRACWPPPGRIRERIEALRVAVCRRTGAGAVLGSARVRMYSTFAKRSSSSAFQHQGSDAAHARSPALSCGLARLSGSEAAPRCIAVHTRGI
ncbi:hypothetical protein BC628DRAFT_701232 [Trametes gibbosa]|nr:hypothetical protein BC628DRAFT_701232 [Trametes gibbosa]